jgi:hypothetical protein
MQLAASEQYVVIGAAGFSIVNGEGQLQSIPDGAQLEAQTGTEILIGTAGSETDNIRLVVTRTSSDFITLQHYDMTGSSHGEVQSTVVVNNLETLQFTGDETIIDFSQNTVGSQQAIFFLNDSNTGTIDIGAATADLSQSINPLIFDTQQESMVKGTTADDIFVTESGSQTAIESLAGNDLIIHNFDSNSASVNDLTIHDAAGGNDVFHQISSTNNDIDFFITDGNADLQLSFDGTSYATVTNFMNSDSIDVFNFGSLDTYESILATTIKAALVSSDDHHVTLEQLISDNNEQQQGNEPPPEQQQGHELQQQVDQLPPQQGGDLEPHVDVV